MQNWITAAGYSDWSAQDRLDYAGTGAPGFQIFGRTDLARGTLFIAIETDGMVIGAKTTLWLNTDRDPATGYQIWGRFGGAEYNVDFRTDLDGVARPYLYTGGAGEYLVLDTPLQHSFDSSRSAVTLAIPLGLIHVDRNTNPTGAIDLLVDINDTVFLPIDYSGFTYTVLDPKTLPTALGDRRAAAIVYSETSAANYFDPAAYSDLLDLVHNRAQERGVPLTILADTDLANLDLLTPFGTLVFPAFQNVPLANLRAIQETLHILSYRYGTGLIAAGNFMTSDEHGKPLPGDAYARMRSLLNVMRTGGVNGVDVSLRTRASAHPILGGTQPGQELQAYRSIATHYFNGIGTNYHEAESLAVQVVNDRTYDAVIATRTGGSNLFFCIEAFLCADHFLDGVVDLIRSPPELELRAWANRLARPASSRDLPRIRERPLKNGPSAIHVG